MYFCFMQDAYSILINKLSAFTQKYYQNQLIKGFALCFTSVALGFIVFSVLEHYGRFSVLTRTILFWAFVLMSTVILCLFIFRPIFKLAKLGNRLSDDHAAKIIGRHFHDVSDKLLNVIQLKKQSQGNLALIEASINQKADELRPIPFLNAIRFSENKRYIKYALIPLFIFAGLYASDSEELITESSARIIDYKTQYIPPKPFEFVLLNGDLECIQHQNYKVSVQLHGKEIPTDAHIELGGQPIKMKKIEASFFEYDIINVQKSLTFKVYAGGLHSETYRLNVLPSPSLLSFELRIENPTYTEKENQVLENTGEVLIPEGSKVTWDFFTENTDSFNVIWGNRLLNTAKTEHNHFTFCQTAEKSLNYTLLPFNTAVQTLDSVSYNFKVVKDGFPVVDVSEVVDSSALKTRYFQGQIKDDYGFRNLQFVVKNLNNKWDSIVPIKINTSTNIESFFFVFDLKTIQINKGESLEYYFEIYDNDAVNGSKKSQSRRFEFNAPTEEEIQDQHEANTKSLKKQLEQNVQLAKDLQEDFEDLRIKLLNKTELSWEDKQQVREILEKQKKLEKSIDDISEKNKENNALFNEFSEQDKRILEKQRQLEELMEELMNDEMRELFDEMEALMEEMKTDEWMKKLEELQMSNEDLEKELDRNLEMLKKFEFEQALDESLEKLEEIIERQQELKESNDEKSQRQESITEQQNELNEDFKKLSEKLDGLQQKNDELEKSTNLTKTDSLQIVIEQQMQESKENSEKNKKKKTSQSQQKALDEMKVLKEKLQQAKKQQGESGPSEDMDVLRQILENLIDLSFDEENLLRDLAKTNNDDPEYVSLIHWQNKLSDDSKILEDSLYSLSKRQAQIKATINREMRAISNNIQKSLDNMSERESDKAVSQQQLVMTSANNLALMLSDVLKSMQEDMAKKTPGQQQCDKPGSGNPSPSDIKKMQEQLKKQMEEMKKGLEGPKRQQLRTKGKDLAKMMARQEMIRQQLERMAEKLQESENGNTDNLREAIDKMEQTEQDIANDNITNETLKRQNQIIEHLLEAEKAEQEKDRDKKREAKEATQLPHHVQELLEEYQKNKIKQSEMLRTIPAELKPYYKDRVKEYFQSID